MRMLHDSYIKVTKENYEQLDAFEGTSWWNNRRIEIDMIAFKEEELVVISCRNALDVKCLMSFRLDIKQKAHKLEYRMHLLNADAARLYIKVTKENYDQLVTFEGTWVDSVEIIFIIE